MTEAQLQAVFKRHGLEVVNPINEKFDPNYHEALFQQVWRLWNFNKFNFSIHSFRMLLGKKRVLL